MHVEDEVRSLQNLLRRDPGIDGDAQRIEQLAILLLLRICTSSDSSADLSDIPAHLRWDEWTFGLFTLPDEAVVPHVLRVLAELRALSGSTAARLADLLASSHLRVENGTILRALIDRMNQWVLSAESERHDIGAMYEHLVAAIGSAGNAGEFYTPRPLTAFMAAMVGLREGDRVLDPAVGTAGMLVSAVETAQRAGVKIRVSGVEKKPLPTLLAATNLVAHGYGDLHAVQRGNLLACDWHRVVSQHDVILSNPPFGASEEPGVSNLAAPGFRSSDTLDLFMGRIPRMLDVNGRAAVVVPDGFLFGDGVRAALRKTLVEDFALSLVVRFPSGVFSPYTSIASNVLFFSRTAPLEGTWFFDVEPPAGRKAFSRTHPLTAAKLREVSAWWAEPTAGPNAMFVSSDELRANGYGLDLRPDRAVIARGSIGSLREAHAERAASDKSAAQAAAAVVLGAAAEPARGVLAEYFQLAEREPSIDLNRLRIAVLQLAATGWLSSPNTHDESFAELGQVKTSRGRSLPLNLEGLEWATHTADWRRVRLDAVGKVVGGGTPDTRKDNMFSDVGGVPWVTPADLRGHTDVHVYRGRRYLTPMGLASCSAKLVPAGSVLFSTRAPIGYVAIAGEEIATNQGFRALVPYDMRVSKFLYYALRAFAPLIDRAASGTTFREVNASQFAGIELAIPSLTEMASIVAMMDHAMQAFDTWILRRDELKRACQDYDAALASAVVSPGSITALSASA